MGGATVNQAKSLRSTAVGVNLVLCVHGDFLLVGTTIESRVDISYNPLG